MKRWLSIVLALSMAFAVLGCEDDDSSKKSKSKGPKITGNVINLNGGDSIDGDGGDGGDFEVDWDGTGGIKFLKSGWVDTSFAVPTYTNVVNLGADGWIVGADTTIASLTALEPEPADGVYHMHDDNNTLYARVAAADVAVTGIKINRGVTLTLGLNRSPGGTTCLDEARLILNNDLEIKGTLTVKDLTTGTNCVADPEQRHGGDAIARDSGSLDVNSYRLYIRGNGTVSTQGDDALAADERGGDGGYIYMWGEYGVYSSGAILANGGDGDGVGDGGDGAIRSDGSTVVYIESDGPMTNTGAAEASGGAGGDDADGGDSGAVYIDGEASVWSSGSLISNGGIGGTYGYGGDANYVELYSAYASVFFKGIAKSIGGDSGYDAGDGYAVYLYPGFNSGDIGSLISSGTINVSGGNATYDGAGGAGGDVRMYSYGSFIRSTTRLLANGGDGYYNGDGGDGGDMYFYLDDGECYDYGEPREGREIVIANDIIAHGGDGGYYGDGGDGGYMYFEDTFDGDADFHMQHPLRFIGFNSINMNGGDGYDGGEGGYIYFDGEDDDVHDIPAPLSGIIFNVPIKLNGGDGTDGVGGAGGWLESNIEGEAYDEDSKIISNTRIELNGGNGVDGGGYGGYVYLWAHAGVKNNGSIIANGGRGTGAGSYGGDGYGIYLMSTNDVINNGVVSINGGNGVSDGGYAGGMYLYAGGLVINNSTLQLRGGDGAVTGGDGGELWTLSQLGKTRNNGTVDVRGGTIGGLVGFIYFDFADITPLDGTLGF